MQVREICTAIDRKRKIDRDGFRIGELLHCRRRRVPILSSGIPAARASWRIFSRASEIRSLKVVSALSCWGENIHLVLSRTWRLKTNGDFWNSGRQVSILVSPSSSCFVFRGWREIDAPACPLCDDRHQSFTHASGLGLSEIYDGSIAVPDTRQRKFAPRESLVPSLASAGGLPILTVKCIVPFQRRVHVGLFPLLVRQNKACCHSARPHGETQDSDSLQCGPKARRSR